MSFLNEANICCPVQHQEMIIKIEAPGDYNFHDSLLSSKLKCENDWSCHKSSELNNLENSFPPSAIKQEPEDSGYDFHEVKVEQIDLKEEIDMEEYIPRWELVSDRNNVGFKEEQCDTTVIYKCSECPYQSEVECNLFQHYKHKHLREAHQEVYKCKACGYETRIKDALNQHYRYICKHTKDAKLYKCEECPFETIVEENLTRHYKCKHSKNFLMCKLVIKKNV